MKKIVKTLIKRILEIPANIYNCIFLKLYNIQILEDSQIHGKLLIRGHGKTIIGRKNVINSGYTYNPIGGDGRTAFIIYDGAIFQTGDYVGLSNCVISARKAITIGDGTIIGAGTKIFDHDFHPLDSEYRNPDVEDKISVKPVHIGSKVFVGLGCIILKGVTIGNNAIIGAGSVVTCDVPENEIWGGNPAKFLRSASRD